eukprot:jgi/Chrzof1/729/Cz01g26170.t1
MFALLPADVGWCAGKHRGRVMPTPHGSLLLTYEWDDPFGGSGSDEFVLAPDGHLLIHTNLHVGNSTVQYTQVYRRR